MEILKILQESADDLYITDLDLLETELATGGIYDEAYQAQCRSKIKELRLWLTESKETTQIPEPEPKSADAPATPEQNIISAIKLMRDENAYKTKFKSYIIDHPEIDSAFVDKHALFFNSWEVNVIISVREMPEWFFEKYSDSLDYDKVARHQQFSEKFFINHFDKFDAETVLKHGKNAWRKKENLSNELYVFLKLKGVKI